MAVRRHTKIVATLGPACATPAAVDALIGAGVDIFRLNFSHGTHETHAASFRYVREAAARRSRHIAVLQDLSGPKIRIGALEGHQPISLREGQELRIAAGDGTGNRERVYTPFAPLITSVKSGDRLLLDDGRLELRVERTADGELVTSVVNGGPLGEHKGINSPGVDLPAGALTEKDAQDLKFGLELGVDIVALSFVQTVGDIRAARAVIDRAGRPVPLVAKIERPQGVKNLDAILEEADGVMVARGDLGLECPLEEVPRIQKHIVMRARALGRPVILATQVLESMRTEPRPTRAEVSDAATAVDQGADAIMLSGETATGTYPVKAVQTLVSVIVDAESVAPSIARPGHFFDPGPMISELTERLLGSRHGLAMCEAAVTLAATGQAEAIVALTRQGKTAQLLSALRPMAAILAITDSEAVARSLALPWGVTPLVSQVRDLAGLEPLIKQTVRLSPQAVVVFISLSPDLARHDANFLNVQQLT